MRVKLWSAFGLAMILMIFATAAFGAASCPTNSPANTQIWDRFMSKLAAEYGESELSERARALARGHALGRLAIAVQGVKEKEQGFACIELGLEQLYASDLVFGAGYMARNYKLLQEAAYGFHNDEVQVLTGVSATSALGGVFDELDENDDETIIFADSAKDLGGPAIRSNDNFPVPGPGSRHPCIDPSEPLAAEWAIESGRSWGSEHHTPEKGGFLCYLNTQRYWAVSGQGMKNYRCDDNWENCQETGVEDIFFETVEHKGDHTRYTWSEGQVRAKRTPTGNVAASLPQSSPVASGTSPTPITPTSSGQSRRTNEALEKIQREIAELEADLERMRRGERDISDDRQPQDNWPGSGRVDPCPDNAGDYRGTGRTITCSCSASAIKSGLVTGVDVYSDDSSPCAAARHAGMIPASGGDVTFTMRPGRASYAASVRNDIMSMAYGQWDGSFSFGVSTANIGKVAPQNRMNMQNWKVNPGQVAASYDTAETSAPSDGQTSYYLAPKALHGDWSRLRYISYVVKSWGGDFYRPDPAVDAEGDIIIFSGEKTMRFDVADNHGKDYYQYRISLDDPDWRFSGGAYSARDILSNVTAIHIRAEYGMGEDFSILREIGLE